jgi:hypothetical protein
LKNQIFGLELDPEIAASTAKRLKRFDNVNIIPIDAVENLPPDATVVYLYHPFGEKVVKRLRELLQITKPERVRVFYYNCVCAEVFEHDRRFNVE